MMIRLYSFTVGFLLILPLGGIAQFYKVACLDTTYVSSLVADSVNFFAASFTGGVYKSIDHGETWMLLNLDLAREKGIESMVMEGASIYAGTSGSGIYKSEDGGVNWTAANKGIFLPQNITSLACTDSMIIAGTYGEGIYRCKRGDDQWLSIDAEGLILSLTAVRSTVFAATNGPGVYRSTDNGYNWTYLDVGFGQLYVTCVGFDGRLLYAVTAAPVIIGKGTGSTQGPGVFVSTDSGSTWSPASYGLNDRRVFCLALSADDAASPFVLAGMIGGGVYLSTDTGSSWRFVGDGLPSESVSALTIVNSYVIVGTFDGSVWCRPLSEIITAVNPSPATPPKAFELHQNYPNPFNATTTVQFTAPRPAFSVLSVWNNIGQKVATLVSQRLPAGSYAFRWDASCFASGVYYFRLQAEDFLETKKSVFLK